VIVTILILLIVVITYLMYRTFEAERFYDTLEKLEYNWRVRNSRAVPEEHPDNWLLPYIPSANQLLFSTKKISLVSYLPVPILFRLIKE